MVERRLISRVSGETVFVFFCTYSRNRGQLKHYCECLTENQPHTQPPAGSSSMHKKGEQEKRSPISPAQCVHGRSASPGASIFHCYLGQRSFFFPTGEREVYMKPSVF